MLTFPWPFSFWKEQNVIFIYFFKMLLMMRVCNWRRKDTKALYHKNSLIYMGIQQFAKINSVKYDISEVLNCKNNKGINIFFMHVLFLICTGKFQIYHRK